MVSFWRPFSPLFPLFWVNQKGVFCTFLKMGKFCCIVYEKNILNRFPTCGLLIKFKWNNFFWHFEKIWFFPFLTQLFFSQKNLSFQKWKKKMIFDGVCELAIVDLVDTGSVLISKIVIHCWFFSFSVWIL